jgi:purine-cytosine permease-like protein
MNGIHHIRLGKWSVPLPRSAALRIAMGVLLILCGFVGFLPILGFWMVPVGVVVLSIDLPIARRLRRKVEVWWGKRSERKAPRTRARLKEK